MHREPYLFLSYRSIERDFALQLAADLKGVGVSVWMDVLDHGIRPGDDWVTSLEKALNEAAGLLAIVSPAYITAKYCRRELQRIDSLGRPIFPILLYPLENKTDVPLELQNIQFVDFTNWHDRTTYNIQFAVLINGIKTLLSGAMLDLPDLETHYLMQLIARLEARKGVLEYVELFAETDSQDELATQTRPRPGDDWAAGFSELIVEAPTGLARDDAALGRFDFNNSAASLQFSPEEDVPESLDVWSQAIDNVMPDDWLQERADEIDAKNVQPDSDASLETRQGATGKKVPLNSIFKALEIHHRFVLIGDPGAGKTTTVRQLALRAARYRLENPRNAPLPLLLFLPQWKDEATPLDFIRANWPFHVDVEVLLKRGDVLLYLDGLNEMGADGPRKIGLLRQWLNSDSGPAYLIVTCRANDYTGEIMLSPLPTVQVEEMNVAQIQTFVENYLRESAPSFLHRYNASEDESSRRRGDLLGLASNPYMLAAMLYVYQKTGDLPGNMGSLFQRLARALWERERYIDSRGWVEFPVAEEAFARLAFAMIDNDQPLDVPLSYAYQFIGDENLLKIGVRANFIEIRGESLRFYHQLVQEYFAAVGLMTTGLESRLEPAFFTNLGQRVASKWDQVVISLCGIAADSDSTLARVIDADPWLAQMVVNSGIAISQARQSTILDGFRKALDSDFLSTQIAAVTQIAKLETGAIPALEQAVRNPAWNVRAIAAQELDRRSKPSQKQAYEPNAETQAFIYLGKNELAGIELGEDAIPAMLTGLHDAAWSRGEFSAKFNSLIKMLGQIRSSKATLGLCALLDDNETLVRATAAFLLRDMGDAQAIPYLIDMLGDRMRSVRRYVVDALVHLGPGEQMAAVIQTLMGSPFWWAREAAAEVLGLTGTQSAVRPLIDVMQHDLAWDVRNRAAWALGYLKQPTAVNALIEALHDPHPNVRASSAAALGAIGDKRATLALWKATFDSAATVYEYGLPLVGDIAIRALEKLGAQPAEFAVRRRVNKARHPQPSKHVFFQAHTCFTSSLSEQKRIGALDEIPGFGLISVIPAAQFENVDLVSSFEKLLGPATK